jgi:ORF 12 gene product N-terminal
MTRPAAAAPATSSTTSPAAWPPDTPAGAQACWLVTAMAHLPIGTAELRAHFDANFLAQHSPDQINQVFLELAGVEAVSFSVSDPSRLIATGLARTDPSTRPGGR